MIQHYLIVARRNLWKHKSFSIITVLGLALAMAAAVFIFLYVRYETRHDSFWKESGQIYRIVHDRHQNGVLTLRSARAFHNMGRTLQERTPSRLICEPPSGSPVAANPKNQFPTIQPL